MRQQAAVAELDQRTPGIDDIERLHGLEEYTGAGIVLALRRRIVERHGGQSGSDPLLVRGGRSDLRFRQSTHTEHVRPDDGHSGRQTNGDSN